MTITPIKTKAELAFAEQIAANGEHGVRAAAARAFAKSGLPHRKLEAWKYTDLRTAITVAFPVAKPKAFSDVELAASLGPFEHLDADVIVFVNGQLATLVGTSWEKLRTVGIHCEALATHPVGQQQITGEAAVDPQINLGLALANDGVRLRVRDGVSVTRPIHIVNLATSKEAASAAVCNYIEVGADADVTIVESHLGLPGVARQEHTTTVLTAGKGATVQHLQLIGDATLTTHLGSWVVDLGADAQYSAFQMSESPELARNQLFVSFKGEGASFTFNAAMLGRGKSHIDTTMVIDHAVPKCTSRELAKAVLDGEARGVFQGKVIVRPDAQKSDGKQSARALLLSPNAEFDSKPELEIYADDVICGHGSTVAEPDEDQVFYLMARGIPKAQARALLVEAFAAEAIESIAHEGVREAMRARLRAWLGEAKP